MLERFKPYLKFGAAMAAGTALVTLYQGFQVYTYLKQVLTKAPRLPPAMREAN